MKQQITVKQYMELSSEGADKFYKWRRSNGRKYGNLITIGQMIEFLRENSSDIFVFSIEDERTYFPVYVNNKCYEDIELCDNLWEAVKNVLNN